ncbi:MAG: hypothetical protein RIT15_176 [Pseudomonadota bacterium]|jgi:uncharacterized protein GlcG (DUF336 family)
MTQLTLAKANEIITAALAHSKTLGYSPMGVAIVDTAGQLKAYAREEGATALRFDIALGKASASIGMSCNSRALAERTKTVPVFLGAIASVSNLPFIPQTGAVLIKDASGAIIGAVGASGGTGDEDEAICMAGVIAAGLAHG